MVDRQDRPFNTRVKWVIEIKKDRSAKHDLHIEILDLRPPVASLSQRISLGFESSDQVDGFKAITNGQECRVEFLSGPDDRQKIYACNLEDIKSKYGENVPETLEVRLTFDEKNAIGRIGHIAIAGLYYDCSGFGARSIEVELCLPQLNHISYLSRWAFKTFLREKAQLGVYRIHEIEGGKGQKWHEMAGRLRPVLRFTNPERYSAFPRIHFGYELTGNIRFWAFLMTALLAILTFVLGLFNNVLANKPCVVQLVDKLWAHLSKLI